MFRIICHQGNANRNHNNSTRVSIIKQQQQQTKKQKEKKCWRGCGKTTTLAYRCEELCATVTMAQRMWKPVWPCLKKSNTELPYGLGSAIPGLTLHGREKAALKTLHTKAHGGVSHSRQAVWRQPKSPSPDEWINKMWSLHMVEYHLA